MTSELGHEDHKLIIDLDAPPYEIMKSICTAISQAGSDLLNMMADQMSANTPDERADIANALLTQVIEISKRLDDHAVKMSNDENIVFGTMILAILQAAVWGMERVTRQAGEYEDLLGPDDQEHASTVEQPAEGDISSRVVKKPAGIPVMMGVKTRGNH